MLQSADDPPPSRYLRMPHVEKGMAVGLFGGSFNPPHAGHALVAEIARRRLALDQLWWIVTPGNPLKSSNELAPLADRLKLSERVAKNPRIKVTAFEAAHNIRYTADTLALVRAKNPGVYFVWIMGADSLASFHRWKGWTQIMQEVPVAVVSRPWISLKSRFSPAAHRFARYRLPSQSAIRLPGSPTPAWVFLFGRFNFQSSTALRERLRRSAA